MRKKLFVYFLLIIVAVILLTGCKKAELSERELPYQNIGSYKVPDTFKTEIHKKYNIGNNKESYLVPMIMYHRVYTERTGDYCITPQEFETDLSYIKENGYSTVTVRELIDYKEDKFAMPDKPVALTFDDCNYDNYSHVLPLLKKYNMKATFFVIGEFSERFSQGKKRYPATSHLSFDDLAEMNKSGLCDIQNHTYDFHDWTRGRFGVNKLKTGESYEEYRTALTRDLSVTQRLLTDNTGITPNAFAYPFGAYNADAEKIISEMGFRAIVTASEGVNIVRRSGKDDMMRLKRFNRPHGEKNLKYILTEKVPEMFLKNNSDRLYR